MPLAHFSEQTSTPVVPTIEELREKIASYEQKLAEEEAGFKGRVRRERYEDVQSTGS